MFSEMQLSIKLEVSREKALFFAFKDLVNLHRKKKKKIHIRMWKERKAKVLWESLFAIIPKWQVGEGMIVQSFEKQVVFG